MRHVLSPKESKLVVAVQPKKRGRRRKSELLNESKRAKEEEKENLRRKSVSSTPNSGSSSPKSGSVSPKNGYIEKKAIFSPRKSPRISPRKVKNVSPRKGKKNIEPVVVEEVKHRRKSANPKSLTELKSNPIVSTPENELFHVFFDEKKRHIATSSDQFLCRNVRKSAIRAKSYRPKPLYTKERVLDVELMRNIRTDAMKRTGQRPMLTMEFERIVDWTSLGESDNINELTATAIVAWKIAIVDHDDNVITFDCGFAVVPLFRQVEENMGKLAMSRTLCLKFRQFTCQLDLIRNMRDIYLIVEVSRFVSKDTQKFISGGKRRRIATGSTVALPSVTKTNNVIGTVEEIDRENYCVETRFGCRRLLGMDRRGNMSNSLIEGVSDLLLVQKQFSADLDLSNDHWTKNLAKLQEMDYLSMAHRDSFAPRLIFSVCDQRLPSQPTTKINISPRRKRSKIVSPRKETVINNSSGKQLQEVLLSFLHDGRIETKKCVFDRLQCPVTRVPFVNKSDLLNHLIARFPCFSFELVASPGGFDFQMSPNVAFFEKDKEHPVFKNYIFYKKFHQIQKPIIVKRDTPIDFDEFVEPENFFKRNMRYMEGDNTVPDMDVQFLPCRIVRHLTRTASEMCPNSKKGRKNLKNGMKIEDAVEEMDLNEFVAPGKRFVHENSRLLNEIALRRKQTRYNLKPLPNPGDDMQVINFQRSDQQVIEYKQRQEESACEFEKLKYQVVKKKGKFCPKKWQAYSNNSPSTSKDEVSPRKRAIRALSAKEVLDEPAANGGIHLDVYGYPIPVGGILIFPSVKIEMYNAMFREFMAAFGWRWGSRSIEQRYELLTKFAESFGSKIAQMDLDDIYLKHLELMSTGSSNCNELFMNAFYTYQRCIHQSRVETLD